MPLAPPKTKTEVEDVKEINIVEPLQLESVDIKHVIRAISTENVFDTDRNIYPVSVVEDHIKQNYLSQGYKLVYIQHLQTVFVEQKPIAESMLYVLVKESS